MIVLHKKFVWVAALSAFICGQAAHAQNSGAPSPAVPERPLAPQDKLSYRVAEDPSRNPGDQIVTVSALGEIRVPVSLDYADSITIQAKGRTVPEVREDLARKLEADYYQKATVHLQLETVRTSTGKAYFFGEVKGAVNIVAGENLTVSKALLDRGYSEWADLKRVIIHRVDSKTGEEKKIEVNVQDILDSKKGSREKDVVLQDEDRVEVSVKKFRLFD